MDAERGTFDEERLVVLEQQAAATSDRYRKLLLCGPGQPALLRHPAWL